MCPSCSEKLNYHSRKREVKRLKKRKISPKKSVDKDVHDEDQPKTATTSSSLEEVSEIEGTSFEITSHQSSFQKPTTDEGLWKKSQEADLKGRDEEFDDYLNDLLL